MAHEVQPLPFKPRRLDGLSERLLVSHYENNYGGALRRLNAIEAQLERIDWASASGFELNGLGRERLIAANSVILHEAYFECLGGSGDPAGAIAAALVRDFGSPERWRAAFTAMGRALAGGSGWVLTSWSPRFGRLINQWAADHGHILAESTPILALDMYEHAYALDFGAQAGAYVDAFMRNIHWPRVEARWLRAIAGGPALPSGTAEEATITPGELRRLIDGAETPPILDVCLPEDITRRENMIPGARFLRPEDVAEVAGDLPKGRPVVVYCIYGFQVSGEASAELRRRGIDARRLIGGLAAWRAMAGPLVPLCPDRIGEAA